MPRRRPVLFRRSRSRWISPPSGALTPRRFYGWHLSQGRIPGWTGRAIRPRQLVKSRFRRASWRPAPNRQGDGGTTSLAGASANSAGGKSTRSQTKLFQREVSGRICIPCHSFLGGWCFPHATVTLFKLSWKTSPMPHSWQPLPSTKIYFRMMRERYVSRSFSLYGVGCV